MKSLAVRHKTLLFPRVFIKSLSLQISEAYWQLFAASMDGRFLKTRWITNTVLSLDAQAGRMDGMEHCGRLHGVYPP